MEDQKEQEDWYVALKKLMEEEQNDEEYGEGADEDDDGYCTLPPAAFFKEVRALFGCSWDHKQLIKYTEFNNILIKASSFPDTQNQSEMANMTTLFSIGHIYATQVLYRLQKET